jgi:hypothetical protein
MVDLVEKDKVDGLLKWRFLHTPVGLKKFGTIPSELSVG